MGTERAPEHLAAILARLTARCAPTGAGPEPSDKPARPETTPEATSLGGHYDFDLAEFPLFRLGKVGPARSNRSPLTYTDRIVGRDGAAVNRSWTVYPGPFGFGGQSTQVLLFDLLQLYAEQGARGSQIQFGTLRSLFLRRGRRNPSKRDYDRLRRDLDVLRGYDIHCRNAFWDSTRQAYVDMNWRLFGSVFYLKSGPSRDPTEHPFGFIEVSSVLRAAARTRGLFILGFDRHQFYRLRPLEQRLALYLSKQFTSQQLHRRFVADLARVLPVDAAREREVRAGILAAAEGLRAKGIGILRSCRLMKSSSGTWVAEFRRGAVPARPYRTPRPASESLAPNVAVWVDRIADAVGCDDDRAWWIQCVVRLGPGAVDRGLGQLKEVRRSKRVGNPGGLLTKIFTDIAAEQRLLLTQGVAPSGRARR